MPFAFSSVTETILDIQFIAEGNVYRYAVVLTRERIVEERLEQRLNVSNKVIFSRVAEKDGGAVTIGEAFEGALTEKIRAQAVVGAPSTRTFLSLINENIKNEGRGVIFSTVLDWFKEITFIGPDARIDNLIRPFKDEEFKSFVEGLLEQATGVARLDPVSSRMSASEVVKMISSPKLRDTVSNFAGDYSLYLGGTHRSELELVHEAGADDFKATELKAAHRLADGRVGYLNVNEESDGTKRLLNLLPAIYNIISKRGVCIIDELDRSMHALLSRSLVRTFLEAESSGQLIFTTQEDAILDAGYLRRDEIWFAEKDENASTCLYSLDDYKVRTRKNPRDYYFEGRYGAIPFEWTLGGKR